MACREAVGRCGRDGLEGPGEAGPVRRHDSRPGWQTPRLAARSQEPPGGSLAPVKRTVLSIAALAFVAIACTTPEDRKPEGKFRIDRGPYLQATTRHEATVC